MCNSVAEFFASLEITHVAQTVVDVLQYTKAPYVAGSNSFRSRFFYVFSEALIHFLNFPIARNQVV